MAKNSYLEKEKKAFHMGRAYAAAKLGKRVDCKTEEEKQSFRNGVKAVRDRAGAGAQKDNAKQAQKGAKKSGGK